MTRIIGWLASTITSIVLLLSYPTSTIGAPPTAQVSTAVAGADASTGSSKADPSTAAGATTYTGDRVHTRYGPVQVQITVDGSTVSDVQVLQVPSSSSRDQQINGYAVPELNAQVVDGDATDVHSVSGASYTSQAYMDSLQSALDEANL
jgi:uncharacterized protein with FMN-binding domain